MQRNKPWLVTDSILYIEEYLTKITNPKILEFGMGASTIWFSKTFDGELTSVEHNKEWYTTVKSQIENKQTNLILKESNISSDPNGELLEKSYSYVIDDFNDNYFDLILIDGRNRVECFLKCDRILKPKGLMILDNSERKEYSKAFEFYSAKKRFDFVQTSPDEFGFYYNNWTTTIWIK